MNQQRGFDAAGQHPSVETLSSGLDCALEASERRALALHLATCSRCQARQDIMSRTRDRLRALQPGDVDLVAARSRLRMSLRGHLLAEQDSALERLADRLFPHRRPWVGVTAATVGAWLLLLAAVPGGGGLRATEWQRAALDRAETRTRFEEFLAADSLADGRVVDGTWFDPGLGTWSPVRRLPYSSQEAQRWMQLRPEVRRALAVPGVVAVRLRAGGGAIEIRATL